MSVLQINFWILFILALFQVYTKGLQRKKLIYFIMCVDLMFFAVFRAPDVGVDWIAYVYSFKRWVEMSWKEIFMSSNLLSGSEIGYTVLNKLIGLISKESQALVIVLALVVFPIQFYFLYKNSDRPGMSLLVYVAMDAFEFSYTYLRQACALTFVLWSFKYVKERKLFKFLICISFGFLFHRSAVIAIPIYFVYSFFINRRTVIIMFAASLALFFGGGYILRIVSIILGKSYVKEFIAGRNRYIFMWVMVIIFYELYIKFRILPKKNIAAYPETLIKENEKYRFLFWNLMMAATVQALAMVSDVFVRTSEFFNASMYILFSQVTDFVTGKHDAAVIRLLGTIFMGVVMYMFYCIVLAGDYRFMWN